MRWQGKALGLSVMLVVVAIVSGNNGLSGLVQNCTVTVSTSQSIQSAINNASANAVICLAEGTWQESLKITKSDLTIRGQGQGKSIITGSLLIQGAQGVTVEKLTLQGSFKNGVELISAKLANIQDTLIQGHGGIGVLVTLDSIVRIERNQISKNSRDGIEVAGSKADLRENQINENSGCGVRADASSTVTGRDNEVLRNAGGTLCGRFPDGFLKTADSIPPRTRAVLSPSANGNGWNNSDVTIMLNIEDNEGGSGIQELRVKINDEEQQVIPAARLNLKDEGRRGSYEFSLSAEGQHRVRYFAIDNAGNHETEQVTPIRIDKTRPTFVSFSPGEGTYSSSITVSWEITDGQSGMDSCLVYVNGNQRLSGNAACRSSTLLDTGRGYDVTVEGYDKAGNIQVVAAHYELPPYLVCLSGCPFSRIQEAIDEVPEGGQIRLSGGTYNEQISISKSLTLQGAGTGSTILRGKGVQGKVLHIIRGNIVIEGLTIEGYLEIEQQRDRPSSITVRLKSSEVTNSPGAGVSAVFVDSSVEIIIQDSRIYGNLADGIEVWNEARLVVENSAIFNNRVSGIMLENSSQGLIVNSRITDNKPSADGQFGDGVMVLHGSQVIIRNSVISGNSRLGIGLWGKNTRAIITNNTINSNTLNGINIGCCGNDHNDAIQAEISNNSIQTNGGCGVSVDNERGIIISGRSNSISGNRGGELCGDTSKFPSGFGGGK